MTSREPPRSRPPPTRATSHFLSSAGAQIDEISARLSRRARVDSISEPSRPQPRLSLWRSRKNGPTLDYSITATEESAPKGTSTSKLNTFEGVFMPTTLNVLSILMFLRFSFIVGQTGLVGTLGLLIISYALNLLTVLSISAISTNGTVRGGGAYYMISRCLGPEFGGSIGIVFYIGQVLNAGMNIVGFVEPLMNNYGRKDGEIAHILPESFWFTFLYGTVLCILCSVICTAGSKFFARVSLIIFVLLGISTISIPISAIALSPFASSQIEWGLSTTKFVNNLLPRFTKGAAGSQLMHRENFRSIFGLLFPATAGIFAGSADSGKLQNPSKSIPRGTLQGLLLTFFLYTSVVLVLAAGVSRDFLYTDLNTLQDINISKYLILLGSLSTATFSALCGINGAAKMLQAIARDDSLPFLSVFKYGTKATDEPLLAIAFTYICTQCVLFADINQIASFVTMTFLLTFAGINLACFLLDVSSAPNFRPSFVYYSWHTALIGFLVSFVIMFFVDGVYAGIAFSFLGVLFLMVHYLGAPKNYGDISQALIYHQVRKFLLRLDKGKEHVKFWRPQILLLINDPRRNLKLIHFCNSLKKSGLYVLGHVMITQDFSADLPELRKQQNAWHKLVEKIKVKAFVQVGVARDEVWGAMNLVLSSGLGGMKPNIVVMSFFNLAERKLIDHPSQDEEDSHVVGHALQRAESGAKRRQRERQADMDHEKNYLPTDSCRKNPAITICTYLNIVEDIIASFNLNVALAKGFSQMEEPEDTTKEYLDLWPIQMSPVSSDLTDESVLSTNFDTYTMILQMGQILHTVPRWRKAYKLRVLVFVEHEADACEEQRRVSLLLENLRIDAELVVLTMDDGKLSTYEILVNGKAPTAEIERALRNEPWWTERHRRQENEHRRTSQGSYSRRRESAVTHNLAIRKRRASSSHHPLSMPLSFRTNVPMPNHDDSTDEEPDHDSEQLDSSIIMPRYTDAAVFDDDEEYNTGMRHGEGRIGSAPDFDASPLPSRTIITNTHKSPTGSDSAPSSQQEGSSRSGSIASSHGTEDGEQETAGANLTISFAPPPANHPTLSTGSRTNFNDLPAKAQHLVINELIRNNSAYTGVLFTTLPPPSAGTYKDEARSEDYLEGLAILCDGLPPCILIHSKSLTVTTAL
ncbi:protein of unknown function [Taphrina deformans PYCC 5710]|uniref:Cation chloride cotransporter n=1 Tax=Taphrina deformans (strain PYCC 5710 / ATCC 11124 / CBS 356.35 / IMI 108563 / JCM 9778 / NBRC 8474) TaxID=1097556 RepID=R4XMD1_TAPDE|nr:protein of unknown function [Taphrina deformans PYCC 5710]|eukprot:CCG84460.1 protein of unknown function [Taphrina deformans PYCC 5710]